MDSEQLIHPAAKSAVSVVARFGIVAAFCTAAAAALELAAAEAGAVRLSLAGGLVGELALALLTSAAALLAPWCHLVLLADRGVPETRLIALLNAAAAFLLAVLTLAGLVSGRLYVHPWQLDLPAICAAALGSVIVFNLPNMRAASRRLRTALVLIPVLMLAAYVTNVPQLALWNDVCKIALGAAAIPVLRKLAHCAPLIASLPEQKS